MKKETIKKRENEEHEKEEKEVNSCIIDDNLLKSDSPTFHSEITKRCSKIEKLSDYLKESNKNSVDNQKEQKKKEESFENFKFNIFRKDKTSESNHYEIKSSLYSIEEKKNKVSEQLNVKKINQKVEFTNNPIIPVKPSISIKEDTRFIFPKLILSPEDVEKLPKEELKKEIEISNPFDENIFDYNEDDSDEEYDEDLDFEYYEDFDEKINKIDVFPILLNKTRNIKAFPINFRNLICNRINYLIENGLKEEDIVKIIINDIIKRNNIFEQNLNNKSHAEFLRKFNEQEYKIAIIKYFYDLVNLVQIIKKNPLISLAEINRRLISFHSSVISSVAKSILSKEEFYERYLKHSAHSYIQSDLMTILDKLLESKKQEILNLEFIPTRENILKISQNLKLMDEDRLYRKVNWWIKHNTPFTGVKQIIQKKSDRLDIYKLLYETLNKNKENILTGHFIPNVKNLAKINNKFDEDLTRNLVNLWLEKNSSFKNLTQLIEFFKPSVSLLGYSLSEQENFLMTHLSEIISSFTLFPLSKDFIMIPKSLYHDILNSILPINDKDAFDIFYESFTTIKFGTLYKVGLRSEKPLAVLLFYYSLIFFILENNTISNIEKYSAIKLITLEKLEIDNGLAYGSLKKKVAKIYSFLISIRKYKELFEKLNQIRSRQPQDNNKYSLIKQFKDDIQYNIFNWSASNLGYLNNNILKEVFSNMLSNIEKNNYPAYIFDLGFPRASTFKFSGSINERIFNEAIEKYFFKEHTLIKKIENSDEIYFVCQNVQSVYNKYNVETFGSDGHKIILNSFFENDYKIHCNFFPLAMEIPVWAYSNLGGITGHIDLLAFYYKDNNLYVLILDFKPNGLSEILKSIPQLTIYGQLFGHHIIYWIKKLNLPSTFNYNFKIKCGGFNNNELYLFDPFETYSHLFTFMTEQLSFAKKSFLDLKTFFASKINI